MAIVKSNAVLFDNFGKPVSSSSDLYWKTISAGGSMIIASGGSAHYTQVASRGTMYVSSRGTATGTDVSSGGVMHVSNGGVASNTDVLKGGKQYVSNGGSAAYTYIKGGVMVLLKGSASRTEIFSSGIMYISSGGSADYTEIYAGGKVHIRKGGTADNAEVSSGGIMYISSGGSADYTDIYSSGKVFVSSGAMVNSTLVGYSGVLQILGGGVANSTTIRSGTMYVKSAGIADTTSISYSGKLYVSSGGEATGTFAGRSGSLYVLNGAVVTDTTVDEGKMYIASGGSAIRTTIEGGEVRVSNGGITKNVTVNDGTLCVLSGGAVENVTVNDGALCVLSGGTATDFQITDDGRLDIAVASETYIRGEIYGVEFEMNDAMLKDYVLSNNENITVHDGGIVDETIVDWGDLNISCGGIAQNTTLSGGSMCIFSGGTALKTYGSDGEIIISDGGIANSTTLEDYGYLYVFKGGFASNTTMNDGHMEILQGGKADKIIVNEGELYISSGGSAANIQVAASGRLSFIVASGTYAQGTSNGVAFDMRNGILSDYVLTGNGAVEVISGGVVNRTTVDNWGYLTISEGGVANSTIVNSAGELRVESDGMANSTIVNSAGELWVEGGGIVKNTELANNGTLYIWGGIASNTTISSGASVSFDYWDEGASAINTTVLSGGRVESSICGNITNLNLKAGGQLEGISFAEDRIFSKVVKGSAAVSENVSFSSSVLQVKKGGVVSGVGIHSSGYAHISNGGTATNARIMEGEMYISRGGIAHATVIDDHGSMYISSGGIANSTTVIDGRLEVLREGIANNTVLSGGSMYIFSGGAANNTLVDAGTIYVYSSGTASNTTLKAGGNIYIRSGGVHRGSLNIESTGSSYSSADFYVYEGGIVDFTLSGRTAEDDYLINDLSQIRGTPTYTISILPDQASGLYKLAQGATDFDQTVTVGENTVLTVNGPMVTYKYRDYSLIREGDDLTLLFNNHDSEAPVVEISGNPTAWTSSDVILTASATDNVSGIQRYEYSFDNDIWLESDSVRVTKNRTVYFRVTDGADNVTTQQVIVNRIDKSIPVMGKLALKQLDQNNVSLTISGFSDDVKIARYDVYVSGKKVGSTTGTTYTYKSSANLTTGSKTFSVKAVDISGQVSNAANATLTVNLAVVGKATSKSTVLTWKAASVSGGLKQYEVVVSGKKYISTTNKITISGLAVGSRTVTVYARSKTNKLTTLDSGDIIKVTDGTAPTGGKVVAAQSGQNNIKVTISGFKDNVKVAKYYVYVNGTKVATTTSTSYIYKSSVNLIGKKTVMVKALDAEGNVSASKSVAITIKDVTAPLKVTGLKVSGTSTQSSAKLVWTKGVDNVGVTKYAVKVSGVSKTYTTTTNSLVVKGLTAGTHTYQVYAYDATGKKSVVSTAYSFNVKYINKPTGGKITLKQASQNSVKITISSFKDNVKVGKYYVYLNGKKIATTTSTTYTYTQSANFTTSKLTFAVKAVDTTGNVSVSKSAAFAAKVRVSGKATNLSTVLTWTKPAISGTLKRYEITVSGKKYTSTTNKITIKGLAVGTNSVTIKAINTSNQSKTVCSGELIKVIAATVNKTISGITGSVKDVDGITGSAANDIVTFQKDCDFNLLSDISLGSGDDKLIIPDPTAESLPGIAFESGAGVSFGAGNDILDLGAGIHFGYSSKLEEELGIDSLDMAAGTLDFGTGNDNFRMRSTSDVTAAAIDLGDGNDCLQMDAFSKVMFSDAGSIEFGDGNDSLVFGDGATLNAMGSPLTLDFGSGTDTMTFNGDMQIFADQLVITGLENITGSGSLVLNYGCTLDDETKAKFEQSGITVTLA